MPKFTFPESFVWGVATSSYQIEGGVNEGGRSPSNWDTFSHTPGNVQGGETGDVACDHYHLWEEDVGHIAALGVKSYRFSIAWPRVVPDGSGRVNEEGLAFYDRLVDTLLAKGIEPVVTLHHWDLPYALQAMGGWANPATVDAFTAYAERVFTRLGDRVPRWITQNEPWVVAFLGHQLGLHAPGTKDTAIALQVAHNLLVSHGKVVQLYRQLGLPGEIGITLNLTPTLPATDNEADERAASLQDGRANRWFLDPVLKGSYPRDIWEHYAARYPMPHVTPGEMELIHQPIDFLGVNYYSVARVGLDADDESDVHQAEPVGEVTDMGWEVAPDGLRRLLMRLKEEYGNPPLYITENGCAYKGRPDADMEVRDPERVAYYEQHLIRCSEAIAKGVNLKGFYAWSLMDNFEWALGYSKQFGLIYVDFETQERVWKQSAHWYRQVASTHVVETGEGRHRHPV